MAKNVLRWGQGGLNIDASRIGYQGKADESSAFPGGALTSRQVTGGGLGAGMREHERGGFQSEQPTGRWPANLILMHKPDCRQVGTQQVAGYTINRWSDGAKPFGGGAGHPYESEDQGPEILDLWNCVEGCPVLDLDEQTGTLKSGEVKPHHRRNNSSQPSDGGYHGRFGDSLLTGFGDKGGASRYFKQVETMTGGLIDYLITMISPPVLYAQSFFISDLATADWKNIATWPSDSMQGFVAQGTPTTEQAVEMVRVLRPGAHLMLIAPDEQPTGHTGACRLEDEGFEIRDAILIPEGTGGLHYVPKAARKEREEGCEHLQPKKGHEAVERKAGTAGLNNPRAGAGRTASQVRNYHPTVKPIGIMERLLSDVPEEDDVCDLFMGSGTTGIATVKTGHDFIGIEREKEYLVIADARVNHWVERRWSEAVIESDLDQEEPDELDEVREETAMSLVDFLMGGGE